EAPAEFLVSNEADVFPRDHTERSELIDATIGEGSPFQNSFGYFAHGIDETTAILPEGWRERLVLVAARIPASSKAGVWSLTTWPLPNTQPGGKRTGTSPVPSLAMAWLAATCWSSG